MKVQLVFNVDIPAEQVGTSNDLLITAIQQLKYRLRTASSTDDAIDVFSHAFYGDMLEGVALSEVREFLPEGLPKKPWEK